MDREYHVFKKCSHFNFIASFHRACVYLCLIFWTTDLRSYFFIITVRNYSFFTGSIFCSSFVLVWIFNTRGVHNVITKKANIPVNLVLFFNGVSFLFCCFLKPGVSDEPKSLFLLRSKKVRVIYSKQDKTLLSLKR